MTRPRLALLVAVGLLAAACSDSSGTAPDLGPNTEAGVEAGTGDGPSTPTITVTSDDGKATLKIPEGALPSGVSSDQIKITALKQSDVYGSDMKGWTWRAGYRLEPDGTTLSAPATLTVALSAPFSGAAVVLHQRKDAAEALAPTATEVDSNGDVSALTVELAHFSTWITLTDDGDPGVDFTILLPATDHFVGESFLLAVGAWPKIKGEKELPLAAHNLDEFPARRVTWDASTWTYHRRWEATKPPLSPFAVGNFLAEDVQMGDTAATPVFANFTCDAVGPYSVLLRLHADLPGDITFIRQGGNERGKARIRQFGRVERAMLAAKCVAAQQDASDDCIDSVKTNTCTYKSDEIDITGFDSRTETVDQTQADAAYGSGGPYACGRDDSAQGGNKVVCPEGGASMPAGKVYSYTVILKTDVPLADTGHSLIYSLVVDSDGDPANDWKPVPPFNWDYFQGADRWFQLIWDHLKKVWTLTVTQVNAQQQQSAVSTSTVRAIINKRSITFKVAGAAFSAAQPGYRLTAFGHDGKFSQNDRGGDVGGADPTEPLKKTK